MSLFPENKQHKIEFKDAMVCELPRKLFDILLPSTNENTDDAI